MAIATLNPNLDALLEQTATLHKHLCPRQVLGVRMGIFAAQIFPIELPQTGKRLLAFVETDGCFADGVSVSTGCSMGHRTMRLVDYGKVAATFVDTLTGRALRFIPSLDVRKRAAAFGSEGVTRWRAQLDAYQRIPSAELFKHWQVTLTLDLGAIIGTPGTRTVCFTCGEEILNQREVVKNGQPMCGSCAGMSYWSLKE